MSFARLAPLAMLAPVLLTLPTLAQTFSNSQPITIRDNSTALPYPSDIAVNGVVGPIGSVSVTLQGLMHTFSSDLVIGLRGPDGTIYPLLSRCASSADLNGNYTFVAQGTAPSFTTAPGTYAATQCFAFTMPGVDAGPIGDLNDLAGTFEVDGNWSLFVRDAAALDVGSISGGWSITFSPPAPVVDSLDAIQYQGRLETPDGPVNDQVVARFRLFDAASDGNTVGSSIATTITPRDGVFTVPLRFGSPSPFEGGQPLWLEVSLNGVVLAPRQRIARAPQASHANVASTATTANSVPWDGIASVPVNVANLRVAPAALANSALINGSLGLGAEPLASSRLHAVQPTLGPTDWHIELTNATIPAFRGGIRINNAGFLDVTNNAGSAFGFFARLNSTGAWTVASDARLKTDIRPAFGMLDAAMKLRPVYFHWLNEDAPNAEHTEDFGLIAQEVRDVLPRLVTGDESKDTLTVNYSQLSVVAIGAVKELQAQVDTLRAENETLRARLDALASQQQHFDDLARRLEALESSHK